MNTPVILVESNFTKSKHRSLMIRTILWGHQLNIFCATWNPPLWQFSSFHRKAIKKTNVRGSKGTSTLCNFFFIENNYSFQSNEQCVPAFVRETLIVCWLLCREECGLLRQPSFASDAGTRHLDNTGGRILGLCDWLDYRASCIAIYIALTCLSAQSLE